MSKRRPNGDGMVRKRPDGRWEARIIVGHKENGKPIYKSVFGKTQSEAMTKFYKLLETYRGVELNEDCLVNLNEWLDRWLCYQKDVVRPQTLNKYIFYADAYVRPYLGDKKISVILTRDMQQLYVKLLKEGRVTESKTKGKSLSGSTVRAVHMMMHKCYNAIKRQGEKLEDAASKLFVSVETIKSWNRNGNHFRCPKLENIIAVSKYTNIKIQDLLN